MRVLAPATEDDMVLTFLRAEVDSPRFAGPLLLALGEQASIVRSSIGRIGPTPRKMRPAGDCLPRIVATAGTRLSSPACRMTFTGHGWRSPPRSSPMSATSIGTTGSRSRAGPGDPGTRSRACAPTGTQRAATTAGSLSAAARGSLPPELVVLGRPPGQDLVLLEGHVRLTGLLLDPQHLPGELRVLLGTSPRIAEWGLYGS